MAEQLALNFDGQPLTDEERAVWELIRTQRGKGYEVPGTLIAEATHVEYDRVRAIIAHLVNAHHKLIGSNGNGYYIPVTKDEIDEVTRSLRHRGIMILVRAAKLQKTSLVEIFNQASIEFKAEVSHE